MPPFPTTTRRGSATSLDIQSVSVLKLLHLSPADDIGRRSGSINGSTVSTSAKSILVINISLIRVWEDFADLPPKFFLVRDRLLFNLLLGVTTTLYSSDPANDVHFLTFAKFPSFRGQDDFR